MSIENEIKKLRESIESLTNAITESKKPVITENRIDPEVQKISIGYKPAEKIAPVEEQSKTIKKVEIKNPPKPLEYEVDNEKNKAKFKVTNDNVFDLAKEKIKAGVDRFEIKSIVVSYGDENTLISDLKESDVEECYNKINELQPE